MINEVSYLSSDELEGRETGTRGEKMAAEYISNKFQEYGLVGKGTDGFFQIFEASIKENPHTNTIKKKIQATNVVGYIDNNQEETIIIGAHYDHIGYGDFSSLYDGDREIHNGADDNATGTAMVLELFEKYASTNNHKRTLVFILFGGEELGLLGSKFYAENPTVDLEKVQLMVNLDMVGRLDENKNVYLGGVPTAYGFSETLKPFFEESELNVTSYEHTASGVRSLFSRSDHYNFYRKDVPSLFFFTGIHKDYHTPRDEANLVNYEGLKLISDLAEKVINNAANRSDRIEFRKLPKLEEESEKTPARMKVSFGVMPNYAHQGSGLKIDAVLDNRPAKNAGMKDGDVIIKIQDILVDDIYKYMEILSKIIRGVSAATEKPTSYLSTGG